MAFTSPNAATVTQRIKSSCLYDTPCVFFCCLYNNSIHLFLAMENAACPSSSSGRYFFFQHRVLLPGWRGHVSHVTTHGNNLSVRVGSSLFFLIFPVSNTQSELVDMRPAENVECRLQQCGAIYSTTVDYRVVYLVYLGYQVIQSVYLSFGLKTKQDQ